MKKKFKQNLSAYMFLAPIVIGMGIFSVYPILRSFSISLYDWIGFRDMVFVGLNNYKEVLTDNMVQQSIFNTFRIIVFALPISLIVSLVISSMLNSPNLKIKTVFRVIFYLPIITMPAAVATVFGYIFNFEYGIVNNILVNLGLDKIAWLGDPNYSWRVIVFMVIWSTIGTQIIILLAAMQSVDKSIYEAAEIDGAGPLKKLLHITIPSISPSIFFLTVTGFIGMFQLFDIIYVMVGKAGGIESTRTVVYTFYEVTFTQSNKGLGAAVAVVIFFIVLIITGIQKLLEKRFVHY